MEYQVASHLMLAGAEEIQARLDTDGEVNKFSFEGLVKPDQGEELIISF